MEFIKQHIEGVWVIQPKRFGDDFVIVRFCVFNAGLFAHLTQM